MRRPAVLWTLAALAGIVLVAGMTLAASRLSTLQVGLSSEPLQAGQALAPSPAATPATKRKAKPKPKPKPRATPAAVATAQPLAPVPTIDDHGGGSSGSGGHGSGGHGSDD